MKKKFIIITICTLIPILLIIGCVVLYNYTHTRPKYQDKLVKLEYSEIYSSAFSVAWEQLKEYIRRDVTFREETALPEELNKIEGAKDTISTEKYYVSVDKTSHDLKDKLLEDIQTKYNIDARGMLNEFNFKDSEKSFTLFAKLDPQFKFTHTFDKVSQNSTFANGSKEISYFGVSENSSKEVRDNIKILFYNNKNDFAISIGADTEELILYRTDKIEQSFDELYEKLKNKKTRSLSKEEEVSIPYISFEVLMSYDELCNKTIQGTNKFFIQNALQSIKFELGQEGSYITQTELVEEKNVSDSSLCFNDKFVIFIKEKEKKLPYFALKVTNDLVLK